MTDRRQRHLDLKAGLAVATLGRDIAVAAGLVSASTPLTPEQWQELEAIKDSIRNKDASQTVHEQYHDDPRPDIRACVARNCPHIAVLNKMVADPDLDVLESLAGNQHASVEILRTLLKNRSWDIHGEIAENPNADVAIQKELAGHKSKFVLEELAENENLVPEVATSLYNKAVKFDKEQGYGILRELAENKRTPREILEKLEAMGDQSGYIAKCANRTLSELGAIK